MPETIVSKEIDGMAEEVLILSQLSAVLRSRNVGADALSEPEYLALSSLIPGDSLTVGEIQKKVGVLPAQMSRILRGLENREDSRPLIETRINLDDRRRVDVFITPTGRSAFHAYRRARLSFICDFLANLTEEERVVFMKIVRDFRARIAVKL